MPFPALELLLVAAFVGLLCGVAGGYGGYRLRARQLANDLDLVAGEFEGLNIRVKKLEGRKTREESAERARADGLTPDVAAQLAALAGSRRAVPQLVAEEDDHAMLQRLFPSVRKAGGAE